MSKFSQDIEYIKNKYRSGGYEMINMKNAHTHFIAVLKKKIHFVRVISDNDSDDKNYSGINDFIQNAKANDAIPIYACVFHNKKGEISKVKFEDVNEEKPVIIRAIKPVVVDKKTQPINNKIITKEQLQSKSKYDPKNIKSTLLSKNAKPTTADKFGKSVKSKESKDLEESGSIHSSDDSRSDLSDIQSETESRSTN
jgi:hypothetical protein